MRELEEAKAHAAAARSRDEAIRSEAEALSLKKKLMDAIKAIEEFDS